MKLPGVVEIAAAAALLVVIAGLPLPHPGLDADVLEDDSRTEVESGKSTVTKFACNSDDYLLNVNPGPIFQLLLYFQSRGGVPLTSCGLGGPPPQPTITITITITRI